MATLRFPAASKYTLVFFWLRWLGGIDFSLILTVLPRVTMEILDEGLSTSTQYGRWFMFV